MMKFAILIIRILGFDQWHIKFNILWELLGLTNCRCKNICVVRRYGSYRRNWRTSWILARRTKTNPLSLLNLIIRLVFYNIDSYHLQNWHDLQPFLKPMYHRQPCGRARKSAKIDKFLGFQESNALNNRSRHNLKQLFEIYSWISI